VNAFVFQMEGGEALSTAFEAPFVVQAPDRTVTLTGYARSQGAVVAAVEMGGRSEFEANWADRIAAGLYRALAVAGVIEPAHTPAPVANPAIAVSETSVLRPNTGGIFLPHVRADKVGTIVAKDTLLGQMLHPVTQVVSEEFRAPFEQTALLLLRPMLAQIEGGAMTYVVAEPSV
jgi:predicted deacylase